jgi:Protein of unknown function (DUF4239)
MSLIWAIAIVVVADALAILALLLVRRGAPEGSYFADGDRASGVFGLLGAGFAIFAGFVVFLAFTSYDESRSGAEAEALAVQQQYETAQFLPPAIRTRVLGELVCYGRFVVHQEWPRMEDGSQGDTVSPWAVALFRSLKAAEPASASAQSAYDKWLDQTSDREEARRNRVHGATGIIPGSIWLALFVMGSVVLAYMLLFADRAEMARSQAMLIGAATTVLVATLLAIDALDNPYRDGIGSLRPIAMERALHMIGEARAAVGDDTLVPCDVTGSPT